MFNPSKTFLTKRSRLPTGFSMLEAVVVVGVLLALAAGGFFAYGPIITNAKTAAARTAASQVYTAVMVAQADGDPSTSANDIVNQYNSSNSEYIAEIRAANTAAIAAMTTAEYTPKSDNDFCLRITNRANPKIYAEQGACSTDSTITPNPTVSPTVTATPTPTVSSTPTPVPTPTAIRPADSNAAGNIVQATGFSTWWTDKSAQSMASNTGVVFGFALSGVTTTSTPSTSDFAVEFYGSPEIAVKATQTTNFATNNGGVWYATIMPEAGGYKEGVGYVTAKVTDKTSGAVSMKSWQLTITPHTGMTQSSYYSAWWTDKSAQNMTSNSSATFGFEIKGAVASDYDVTFTGDQSIGANDSVATFTNYAGSDWYANIKPVVGGFTEGVGTITAKATHKLTGKSFTKTYKLTVTPHIGMTQSSYYSAWWTDKTVNSGASNVTATFGFEIKGAVASDFDVVFTGGQNVGARATQTATFTNYAGSDWYSNITPLAGGFTVGTDTITATATHKLTGKVFTKTYKLTIVEHPGMTASSYYGSWYTDKTATVGSTAAKTFGFEIKGAVASDYTVTITGGSEVNGTASNVVFTNYAGSDWYANVVPGSGGFTAGTATITATATHKLTGKVYTKTYKLTVG